jgi:hypothetical protein
VGAPRSSAPPARPRVLEAGRALAEPQASPGTSAAGSAAGRAPRRGGLRRRSGARRRQTGAMSGKGKPPEIAAAGWARSGAGIGRVAHVMSPQVLQESAPAICKKPGGTVAQTGGRVSRAPQSHC